MSKGKTESRFSLDRRTFLKAAGLGIAGAAIGKFPFQSFTLDEAMAAAAKDGATVVPTICAMCGPAANCGVYAFTKNGRFTKVAGMKESPVNAGAVCPKGQAAPQWVYSPERLKYPMKRVGKKGEGKFQRITWDEAITIIAETLKKQKEKYGPESLGSLSPARRTYSDYIQRFLIAHGSPNYGHSGICAMQMSFGFHYTVGDWPRAVDYANSDLVLIWGKQPIYSAPAQDGAKAYVNAKIRGAKLIAIKPSMEPDVGLADQWVPIRPGTDAALALAMLHVVVNESLIDKPFVDQWCYGYDELKEHVQKYPPAWAEMITGIPAARITEIARLFATTKRAGIDLGNGVEHVPSSNDAIRAVAILIAITGHLDRPGGNIFGAASTMPRLKAVNLPERYTQAWVDKLVYPEFPRPFQPFVEGTSSAYFGLFDSVLTEKPYPIRAIIAPGSQALVSTRGGKRVVEALKKLEFYVIADVARTADMPYADIVVPLATPYEIDHPFEVRGNWIIARNRVIEPLADYKSIFEFFCDLGVKMGYGDDFWGGSMTASMNDQLKPLNMTIDDLRKQPTGIKYEMLPRKYENYETVFKRKSPRISKAPFLPQAKVAIYNTSFKEAGYSPLPEWKEPPESITGTPELTKKYPLILSDYHTSNVYTASWQRNVPYLREIQPYPALHIHPDAARERGIKDGDWVRVESPHGWMKVKAEFFPGIRPDTVMVLHGWWQGCKELGFEDFPLLDGGANVNIMYSVDAKKAFDPVVTAMSSQTLVQITKM
ncbi:MAG TPA: molybdopterin-dependent oxidoreductase [Syntrophorhabdales bacterium]|nr:molybdopterin-dependent oxidoreductase [Syntrophorhabdales bacterium]